MDTEARMQTFLARLWELQAEADLTDAELARKMGVDQALVCRAKRDHARTAGSKFLMGASDVFPELAFILHPNLSILTSTVSDVKEEGAA